MEKRQVKALSSKPHTFGCCGRRISNPCWAPSHPPQFSLMVAQMKIKSLLMLDFFFPQRNADEPLHIYIFWACQWVCSISNPGGWVALRPVHTHGTFHPASSLLPSLEIQLLPSKFVITLSRTKRYKQRILWGQKKL